MICPHCNAEILDDSVFCDQCGSHLRRCTKCGNITKKKFCGKCGGIVEFIPTAADQTSSCPDKQETSMSGQDSQKNPHTTDVPVSVGTQIVISPFVSKFLLCHIDGWALEINSGDILGRTMGAHSDRLGSFPVISSRHGQLIKNGDKWVYMDLGSTNKSYLNGKVCAPNTAEEINNGDELILANVPFVVKIE